MVKKGLINFIINVFIYYTVILGTIISINYSVDASSVIRPQHTQMARLALEGNIIATPENYNERVYQVCIVANIKTIPETIVIGSSRGMFVGEEITGYDDIYNNCVSGGCLEDYYALLGLYYEKFHDLPKRVIIETSPWVFYAGNPEDRWREDDTYYDSACDFFREVNGVDLEVDNNSDTENPYISLSYFRYNIEQWREKGYEIFREDARISTDTSEAADYPDGTIRYEASSENESQERLNRVLAKNGACTYEDSNNMIEIDSEKSMQYEKLIDYLQNNGTEVIIYMQPFSVTQCKYSFDDNLNPGYALAYDYIINLANKREIEVHGGFDARTFGLSDIQFIDYMHLDREGTNLVWHYNF